ncbi:hypothetical protein EPD60_07750 [Flaviaesturariibacter flavus]|uniref:Uncharacterized protein n=1 Tax=Flaviaesturariibacter flavus TaxID=2502780 RepID=A0A4R1BFG0_9BACT|nr:hypothetical protein [Flaviaesturariibacter flavus]TCJ15844.1 hypothetical protein EPD60_07750 [Flaviaesturariibacter flavus]
MSLRPVAMTIAFFSFMLTTVFGLADMMYDFDYFIWQSVGVLIFGNLYFAAVFFLAMFYDLTDRPRRNLLAAFWLGAIPTAAYLYRLYELAVL